MSGHSKWANIHRAKAVTDAKKGKIFTKLTRDISMAAKAGADPNSNFLLRLAVDRAKAANMPSDNIDRAIRKGAGQEKGAEITNITYEAYGPGGVSILIDCQTDNTNRSLTDVRLVVDRSGGKMGSAGTVSWQFDEKGQIIVRALKFLPSAKYGQEGTYAPVPVADVELSLMEVNGVEDILVGQDDDGDYLDVITQRDELRNVHQQIEKLGYKIESADLAKIPKEQTKITDPEQETQLEELLEKLEDLDDVSRVWHNAA